MELVGGGRETLTPVLRTLFTTPFLHSIAYALGPEKTNQHGSTAASMFVNEQKGEGIIVLQNCKGENLDRNGKAKLCSETGSYILSVLIMTVKGQRQFNRT